MWIYLPSTVILVAFAMIISPAVMADQLQQIIKNKQLLVALPDLEPNDLGRRLGKYER